MMVYETNLNPSVVVHAARLYMADVVLPNGSVEVIHIYSLMGL